MSRRQEVLTSIKIAKLKVDKVAIMSQRSTTRHADKYTNFSHTLDSIVDLLSGQTIVFFDTETTGLNPNFPWVQVTEYAAIAYDADTWTELGRIHNKLQLDPEVAKEIQREELEGPRHGPKSMTIKDLMEMSNYTGVEATERSITQGLEEFVEFVNSFQNPILVAHNIEFDLKQIMTALKQFGIAPPRFKTTLDTMKLTQFYLHPLLNLLAEITPADEEVGKIISVLKNPKGRLQATLNALGNALGVHSDAWHEALADTQQLAGIFKALIEYLYKRIEYTKDKDYKDQQLRAKEYYDRIKEYRKEDKRRDQKILRDLKRKKEDHE